MEKWKALRGTGVATAPPPHTQNDLPKWESKGVQELFLAGSRGEERDVSLSRPIVNMGGGDNSESEKGGIRRIKGRANGMPSPHKFLAGPHSYHYDKIIYILQ